MKITTGELKYDIKKKQKKKNPDVVALSHTSSISQKLYTFLLSNCLWWSIKFCLWFTQKLKKEVLSGTRSSIIVFLNALFPQHSQICPHSVSSSDKLI